MNRFYIPAFIAMWLLVGCTGIKRSDEVTHSGFLGAEVYEKMRAGGENEPALIYMSPRVDEFMRVVDKVQLAPVVIGGAGEENDGVSEAEMQALANRFYLSIRGELSKDYEIVEEAGPRTLKLEVALTRAGASNVALEVSSRILPPAIILSTAANMATGQTHFSGEASLEAKITDAETGELIAATVDRRIGGNYLNGKTLNKWGDTFQILDFWAQRMRVKFCEARGETQCDDADV